MSNIGERVLKRRNELGLSQEELASRLGYKSRSSINKIELGINDFPQKKLTAFAQALRCSTNYLVNGEQTVEQMVEDARFDAYIASDPDIKPMLKKFVALPQDKKQAVKDYIDKEFDEFFNGK